MEFEWDPTKAEANLRKHRVSFLKAMKVFDDPSRQEQLDASSNYGEDRWITLGLVEQKVLHVVSTQRKEKVRLISARKATSNERRIYWNGYVPL